MTLRHSVSAPPTITASTHPWDNQREAVAKTLALDAQAALTVTQGPVTSNSSAA